MKREIICKIPREESAYSILIQPGIIGEGKNLAEIIKSYGNNFAIIADAKVAQIYGEALKKSLNNAGIVTSLFTFPGGESSKNRENKALLEDKLFDQGLGRDTCIIAMGGGVSTDLGGFIAATYCRGVPLVMIPTSLLGMVDAGIGGKTGIDIPSGKNMIGSIYQPKKVIIDPAVLKSLPADELRNGTVEMIKHGLISSRNYFERLENCRQEIFNIELSSIEEVIFESCLIKKKIIEEDEKEKGKRNLLNFGHTIGHALELLTRFSISHGEAVAIGILVESYLSVQLNLLSETELARIKNIFVSYQLPLSLPAKFTPGEIMETMSLDKKSLKGKPRFVILETIGSPAYFNGAYCAEVDENLIHKSIEWMNHALCSH